MAEMTEIDALRERVEKLERAVKIMFNGTDFNYLSHDEWKEAENLVEGKGE